ncbi:MAG: hypothetical protein QX194_05540 [Methylococcales bacterium]
MLSTKKVEHRVTNGMLYFNLNKKEGSTALVTVFLTVYFKSQLLNPAIIKAYSSKYGRASAP